MRNVATLCALAGLIGCQPGFDEANHLSTTAVDQAGPTPIYMTLGGYGLDEAIDLTASGPPGARVYFFVGAQADGGGPCASPTVCVDVGPQPYFLGGARVRQNGFATLTVPSSLTSTLTPGDTWYFQAAGRLDTRSGALYAVSDVVTGVVGDWDADGFSSPDDCDDADPDTFPGAVETDGDGRDNDCDGYDDADVLPVVTSLEIDPSAPDTTDTLTYSLEIDDDDPNPTPIVVTQRWYVNGVLVTLDEALSPSFTSKDDVVYVAVTLDDGRDTVSAVSNLVSIGNALPVTTSCDVSPGTGDASTTFFATATATDADGDPVTLRYQWERYTFPIYTQIPGETDAILASCDDRGVTGTSADTCTPGTRIRVVCRAYDGSEGGPSMPSADIEF